MFAKKETTFKNWQDKKERKTKRLSKNDSIKLKFHYLS